jgi:hypothetical protein
MTIVSSIQALRGMTVAELRVEWERLYGDPTRSRNRDYLWRRLAWRIQQLEYGGLSDEAKRRILEIAPAAFLRSQMPVGYQPNTKAVSTPPGAVGPCRDPRLPAPGSTIVRRYKGRDIRVVVLDDGFEWDGRRFDSLSEVAFAVTGSHWSGPLFFGLRKRTRNP